MSGKIKLYVGLGILWLFTLAMSLLFFACAWKAYYIDPAYSILFGFGGVVVPFFAWQIMKVEMIFADIAASWDEPR
jgi:multidrug transporter EmrE-like cation transporter